MKSDSLRSAVVNMVASGCGLAGTNVRGDRPLVEYGLDSVRAIDLLVSLEEEFGVCIPEGTACYLRTVNDIVSYLEETLQAKQAA